MSIKVLLIIRGVPGSGKTTVARALCDVGLFDEYFEADQYFYDSDGNYNWDRDKVGAAHGWCQDNVRHAMSKGVRAIVSNTSTTDKEIAPYLELAKKYGYDVQMMYLDSSFNNTHNVPESTILKMKARLRDSLHNFGCRDNH